MYYRRKIQLALLQQFGGTLARIDFQKLLFLFCQSQQAPAFHFVPYKFGCFSWQAQQDVSTMIKYNQIIEGKTWWQAADPKEYSAELMPDDRKRLMHIAETFASVKGDALIQYVYENYPYYAINSEIAGRLLEQKALERIAAHKPFSAESAVYTIGYEGKSVEQYVNQLITADIKILFDVRKNPLSMKYGFSKNQLKTIVEGAGIRYIHLPELGIDSDKRQDLRTQEDYRVLFEDYARNTLPRKEPQLQIVVREFTAVRRIALTCFEADYQCCHRNKLSEAIAIYLGGAYSIYHL